MNRLAKALHWENAKSVALSEIVISRQCDLVVTELRRLTLLQKSAGFPSSSTESLEAHPENKFQ